MIVASRMPTFFKVIIFVVVASVLMLAGGALVLNRRLCDQRATGRDDGRAVWLFLVARQPDRRDDPDVVQFVTFLDDRLPPLECSWWGSPRSSLQEGGR